MSLLIQGQAKGFVSLILEKYKDPKTSISTAVTESLTKIHKYCLSLTDLSEDITTALNHKNPKIKVDTAKLLQVRNYLTQNTDILMISSRASLS